MSRVSKPFSEIDWTNCRIEIRMESTPMNVAWRSDIMDELLAGLPDASGEFTGYFDSVATDDYYNRMLGPSLDTLMVGPDACSPDVSQPYPF